MAKLHECKQHFSDVECNCKEIYLEKWIRARDKDEEDLRRVLNLIEFDIGLAKSRGQRLKLRESWKALSKKYPVMSEIQAHRLAAAQKGKTAPMPPVCAQTLGHGYMRLIWQDIEASEPIPVWQCTTCDFTVEAGKLID